jgi:hypothetical protein
MPDHPGSQFELNMHLGDAAAHANEAMAVVAMAIQMLFTPFEAPVEELSLRDLYETSDAYDRLIPGFSNNGAAHVNVLASADRFPAVFDREEGGKAVAALAAFVYEHAALQATNPFASAAPSYHELKALIASANPFPMSDTLHTKCAPIFNAIKAAIESRFRACIYLTQDTDGRPRSGVQPVPPHFIAFDQTTSDTGINWCVGAEATPVLEAVILALHITSALAANARLPMGLPRVGDDEEDPAFVPTSAPGPVDLSKPLANASPDKSDVYAELTTLMKTSRGVIDAKPYALWLGMTGPNQYLQAGRAFFAGVENPVRGDGVVGCFDVATVPVGEDTHSTDEVGGRETPFADGMVVVDYVEGEHGQQTRLPVVDGRFEHTQTVNVSYVTPDATGILDVRDIAPFSTQSYTDMHAGGHWDRYTLPARDADNALVGFAVFSPLHVHGDRVDIYKSVLKHFVCVDNDILRRMYEHAGRVYYGFRFDVHVPGVKIYAHTPVLHTSVSTAGAYAKARARPLRVPDALPFTYTPKERNVNVQEIVDLVVKGAQGVHHTNSKALAKTVFAGVINDRATELLDYLGRQDPRYTARADWAVDLQKGGVGAVMKILNGIYEQSVSRAQDVPLVARVLVDVRGPAKSDLVTACTVGDWYYKTSMYLAAEGSMFSSINHVLRDTYDYPTGSSKRCLAQRLRAPNPPTTVEALLLGRPDTVGAIASLLNDFHENSKITHGTQKARNTSALLLALQALSRKVTTLIFFM